jgi:hypothetical protein
MSRFASLPVVVMVLGCGTPLWTPPAEPPPTPPTLTVLGAADRRAVVVGTWNVAFTHDSTRVRPAALPASGVFAFTDTILVRERDTLIRGSVSVDFSSMLGRPMSCFQAGSRLLPIRVNGDSIVVLLATMTDCGLAIHVAATNDSLVGRWTEGGIVCCPSRGRVLMTRDASVPRLPN